MAAAFTMVTYNTAIIAHTCGHQVAHPQTNIWAAARLAKSACPHCTQAAADKVAVRILRLAYMETDDKGSDLLYDARQYLQDRERYARMRTAVAARQQRSDRARRARPAPGFFFV
jgi:predicted metal-dependent phosphotriesterase family hydrolase